MTDFIYSLGSAIEWTFINVLEPLGNIPNNLFIVIGFAALAYWIYLQRQYIAKAKKDGGLI
ncbi:MAG: hypothetical protein ACI8XB_000264 [Patiriisocius sp.]|jgi:hypothetical protein